MLIDIISLLIYSLLIHLLLHTFHLKGILPSHGRMAKFDTVEEKNVAVLTAADGFDNEDETEGMLAVGYY